jgi:hypothetical protein
LLIVTSVTVAAGLSCGAKTSPPSIDPIDNQNGFVGQPLMIQLRASSATGAPLQYSFSVPAIPDLSSRAMIRPYGDGSMAVFTWTPIASDVGQWQIDFNVTDGAATATETVDVEIDAGEIGSNAPVFVQPLGTGTTLDLNTAKCIDVPVQVNDNDTPRVTIAQEPQIIAGATLTTTGDQAATWHWCPSQTQIDAQNRYPLTLSASDGQNPKTIKNYLIVLQKPVMMGCGSVNTGTPPVVTSSMADVNSTAPLHITATVTDDKGIKGAPILYYTTNTPSSPPTLASMSPVNMTSVSGTVTNGVWAADVANPVANMSAGAMVTFYYVIVAQDNDDPTNGCDHTTQAPTNGTFHFKVTNPGTQGNQALCTACTADIQCGGTADNCIRIGASGTYCGKACTGDGDCGSSDYVCSSQALTSVNAVTARQCIPKTGTCMAAPMTCQDDSHEPNDTMADADAQPAIMPGTLTGLVSCPLADDSVANDDWYRIVLTEDTNVTVSIAGGSSSDLDLILQDASGEGTSSSGTTSNESLTSCLHAGTYYAVVYSLTSPPEKNTYTLTYSATPMSCMPTSMCMDDSYEPDDNAAQAQVVDTFASFQQSDHMLCSNNQDWYEVDLFNGDTIYASMAFDQQNDQQDLDFHFYDGTTDLTPCDVNDPSMCSPANGQSSTSNESFSRAITHDGTYYIVVVGYNGAENHYGICISVVAGDCPTYPK